MKILITGALGYVGSVLCSRLIRTDQKMKIYGIDNSSNVRDPVFIDKVNYAELDLCDVKKLNEYFQSHQFDIVIHLAAKIYVHDSFLEKSEYEKNNIQATKNLLKECHRHKIDQIIFASSSTLYQSPENLVKLSEGAAVLPLNPYGETKLECERLIRSYSNLTGYIFRFFNIAGADIPGILGQDSKAPKHVIDRFSHLLASGNCTIEIFGENLNTIDGTVVRDYIHVLDVADLIMKAVYCIHKETGVKTYNCGSETGTSLLQLVQIFESVINERIHIKYNGHHSGDPLFLVSDSSLARKDFGWSPSNSDIINIVQSACEWSKMRKKYLEN
jgi:UDP-glucose 4-epimerase